MSEKEFQAKIIALCELLHLKWFHDNDPVRNNPGFPDLVILGPNGVLWLELKTERGRVTAKQQEWIDGLKAAGQHAYIVRPSAWHAIEVVLCDLAGRTLTGVA